MHSLLCPVASVRSRNARRKEARPGELLSAALDLFVEKGFASTRVEDVARKAGVSKGTLFLYFPSKEDLFKAVVRENISGMLAEWSTQMDSFTGSSAELLSLSMRAWWHRFGSTKASGIAKLMMGEANNFPELAQFYQDEVVEPAHHLIRKILQRGIDRGEFRPFDMQYAFYSVLAPLLFLVIWRHSLGSCRSTQGELDPEKFIESQIQTLLKGWELPGKGNNS